MSAQLDLRKYTVLRGEEKRTEPEPISLPRGRPNLTLLPPVGSEPGQYDLQVLDSNLASKASTTGRAEIRDYVTTLHANLDVPTLAHAFRRAALPLGSYYVVTLVLPLANGAAQSGGAFASHALVVLMVPPILIMCAIKKLRTCLPVPPIGPGSRRACRLDARAERSKVRRVRQSLEDAMTLVALRKRARSGHSTRIEGSP